MSTKIQWEQYKGMLEHYGYNEEQIAEVKKIRESEDYDHCDFLMFKMLVEQGQVKRTRKLKKPRNLYCDGERFYYLEHHYKAFNYCGYFINQEK